MDGTSNRRDKVIHTKSDTRILLPHIVALLIGKEHVSREAALRRVRILRAHQSEEVTSVKIRSSPFFFLPPSAAALALDLRVEVFSLGMVDYLQHVPMLIDASTLSVNHSIGHWIENNMAWRGDSRAALRPGAIIIIIKNPRNSKDMHFTIDEENAHREQGLDEGIGWWTVGGGSIRA